MKGLRNISLLFLSTLPCFSYAQYYELHPRGEFLDSILLNRLSAMDEYLADGICEGPGLLDTFWYENGAVKAHGKCIEKRMVGYWKSYYPNSNPKAEGIIKDGKPYDAWTFYHENGKSKATGKFVYAESALGCGGRFRGVHFEGRWKFWDEKGQLSEVVTFRHGSVHGKYERYHSNGQLLCEGLYVDDQFNALWTYYHPNGQKQREEYYTYDELEGMSEPKGTWRTWNNKGQLIKVLEH